METLLLILISTTVVITLISTSMYMGFVAARSNGWRELAKSHRHSGKAPANRLGFQSATLNEYSFPGTMQFGVTERGLWMKPFFLLFHPPLLLPWNEVEATRLETRFESGVRLCSPEIGVELDLAESTRIELLSATQAQWHEARGALLAEIPAAKKS